MKNIIQKFFGTTKQAVISTACIMAVIALVGAGTAYAAAKNTAANKTSQVFETTETTDTTATSQGDAVTSAEAITSDAAKEIVLTDAGLTADAVTFTKVELDYDDGRIVYDLEFYAENVEYEYEVNANTGAIYSKSKETYVTTGNTDSTTAEADTSAGTTTTSNTTASSGAATTSDTTASSTTTASSGTTTDGTTATQITLDGAKEIALADAGVSSSEATFTKEKQDYEDGVRVYDLEFYTANGEWEYEIRISDGAIVSKSAKEYVSSSGSSTASDTYISVDEAKEIALNKAGLSASDVTFKKAKLDRDDGIMVYEIEFYYGRTEYEVKINATTGAVVEYEADTD
ncbi:MAG: PepSY domain-containing protein [Lachnospiraceae bacterium]|nr:PepSY domain-containing protein [Lachnospiraceae bacterium]